jgi:nucleotide-binding universal stress UspA family protein
MNAAVIVPMVPAIKLKRILYATDFSKGSKAAWPVVRTIASHYGSEVLVAHVLPPPHVDLSKTVAFSRQDEKRQAMNQLAELVKSNQTLGVATTAVVRTGEPVAELEKIVREQAVDLAVLTTHGRAGMKHLLMGSVAEVVFRNISCPVLTVGPHLEERFNTETEIKNILFPTDLSPESRAVFPYLASLAHEYKARITLLHVLPEETQTNPDARNLAEPLRNEMQRIFASQISPECEAEFVIESGNAAERILTEARERKADLIGFGIRKASEFATHLRNTVTYRVLLNANCPVLTCRSHHPWSGQ